MVHAPGPAARIEQSENTFKYRFTMPALALLDDEIGHLLNIQPLNNCQPEILIASRSPGLPVANHIEPLHARSSL
jgi:hypothetical protein